jgi:PleD family two-component response regulator
MRQTVWRFGYCRQQCRRTLCGIDWRRPEIRDGAVVAAAVAFIYALSEWYALPPALFHFALDRADWGVDDFVFVFFFMSAALGIYSYRRVKDLSCEMTARRNAEIEARQLARCDHLTGLPNRRFFVEKLDEVLLKTTATSRSAILMLDLDGFKSINSTFGHAAGDQALTIFSERLSALTPSGAYLSRVGGDEFALCRAYAPSTTRRHSRSVLQRPSQSPS